MVSLHEEYMARHGVKEPIVLYRRKTSLFLVSKSQPVRRRMLSIVWRERETRPGFFQLTYNQAVKDGYESENVVQDVFEPMTWDWDEHETSVLDLVDDIKCEFTAPDQTKQFLAAWETFLYMTDSWLARHMSSLFFCLVGKSLDAEGSLMSRLEAIDSAGDMLRKKDRNIFDFWHCQLKPISTTNSKWISNLIND